MMNEQIEKIKLGISLPPKEYFNCDYEMIKKRLLGPKRVSFRSPQFEGQKVFFDIVATEIHPEATVAMADDYIDKNYELIESKVAPDILNMVWDIGGGTTDAATLEGKELIRGFERTYEIGVTHALEEIATEIIKKHHLQLGDITAVTVNKAIRYATPYCSKCGSVTGKEGEACSCGNTVENRKNIIKIGAKGKDESEIIHKVLDKITDRLAEKFKDYMDELFDRSSGYRPIQLASVSLVGGGAEMFGEMLKEKIKSYVGAYTTINIPNYAVWKTVRGLAKEVISEDIKNQDLKEFTSYMFIDMGNTSVKGLHKDVTGKDLKKPIELLTQMSTPREASSKITPKSKWEDLDLKIESIITEENESISFSPDSIGCGNYYVSTLAKAGKDVTYRDIGKQKALDNITYTMIYAAIATLLAI